MTVILKDPPDASVKIDGVLVPPAAVGVKRAADPGFPEVSVSALGYEPFKQTVTVGPGEEKSLEVSLKKLPEVAPAPVASDPAYRPRQKSDARRTVSYVMLGLGGAGLAVSGVTGGLWLRKRSDLKDECRGDACLPSSEHKISTYHLYGTVSGISLGVGVAGLGAGLLLLLTEPKTEETARASLTVHPLLGLGVLGAEGTFQ